MIDVNKLSMMRNINTNIIHTSLPLVISILSYPLFAAVSLSIVANWFSTKISYFIIGQAIVTIYIRFCENILSGTRILTAQNIQSSLSERQDILNTSWNTSILLSIIGLSGASIFWLFTHLLINNSYLVNLSNAVMCLAVGFPGIFIYNTCAFYLHAHKKTHILPMVSWIANILGAMLMYYYAKSPNASFLVCLLLFSLSRWVLSILGCYIIPPLWRGAKFYHLNLKINKMIELTKFGVSHAINSLFFTGSYFLFSLLLELKTSNDLPKFQVQLCLLGIFSVINSAVINSGCIIYSQEDKLNFPARSKLIFDNFIINVIAGTLLLMILALFKQPILSWMGSSEISIPLFEATYILFVGIYFFDMLQMLFMQIMTYNNDYLLPPLMRIAIFSITALPIAFVTVFLFEQGLKGLLSSILFGTLISSLFIFNRFKRFYKKNSTS